MPKDTIPATAYLIVEPVWRRNTLVGANIVGARKTRPQGGKPGSVVVKLTVEVPRRVFIPFEVDATITAQEGDVGVVHTVLEPFGGGEETP